MINKLLNPGIGILLMIGLCYCAGRLHQWYRTSAEREDAFRDGYNQATKSLFGLAARLVRHQATPRTVTRGTATVHHSASVTSIDLARTSARHRADDNATRRLSARPPRPHQPSWPDDFQNRQSA